MKANNYSYTTPKAPCDTPEAQRQGDVEYTSHWSAIPFQQHDTSPHISYTKVSGDSTFCSLREFAEVCCSQSSQWTHTQTYSARPPACTGQWCSHPPQRKTKLLPNAQTPRLANGMRARACVTSSTTRVNQVLQLFIGQFVPSVLLVKLTKYTLL